MRLDKYHTIILLTYTDSTTAFYKISFDEVKH